MNWKNALERFRYHENSAMHQEVLLKLAAKSSAKGIGAQSFSQHDSNQTHNRKMLMKLLSRNYYHCRQGLALRGHNEDKESSLDGNLYPTSPSS